MAAGLAGHVVAMARKSNHRLLSACKVLTLDEFTAPTYWRATTRAGFFPTRPRCNS